MRKNNSNLSVVDIDASSQRRLSQGNYTFSANGIKDLKLGEEDYIKNKSVKKPPRKETSEAESQQASSENEEESSDENINQDEESSQESEDPEALKKKGKRESAKNENKGGMMLDMNVLTKQQENYGHKV